MGFNFLASVQNELAKVKKLQNYQFCITIYININTGTQFVLIHVPFIRPQTAIMVVKLYAFLMHQ